MKLKDTGKSILGVEVSQISPNGIWLLVKGTEYFLSYDRCPWFMDATVAQIHHVRILRDDHLRWPDLDIDLHLDSLENPEMYPLVYKY